MSFLERLDSVAPCLCLGGLELGLCFCPNHIFALSPRR